VKRLAAVGMVFFAACGSSNNNPATPTSPSPLPQAALVVTVNAQPVGAGSQPGTHLARWNVVVQETAGVGGAINLMSATIRDADSGAEPDGSKLILDASLVAARAGSNRVPARGSLTVPESSEFSLDSGGTRIVIVVAVQFADENGHVVTGTGQGGTQ
jgi:hypothetical protein